FFAAQWPEGDSLHRWGRIHRLQEVSYVAWGAAWSVRAQGEDRGEPGRWRMQHEILHDCKVDRRVALHVVQHQGYATPSGGALQFEPNRAQHAGLACETVFREAQLPR